MDSHLGKEAQMDIGQAISELKRRGKIRRKIWLEGTYLQQEDVHTEIEIKTIETKRFEFEQMDLVADDWEVVA
jgi:hypothetical protein